MKQVKDLMTADIETVTLLDNVYEVAVKMKELNIGFMPVVNGRKLMGIITDRDIVIRGIAEKRPATSKVEKVMTMDIITVSPDTSAQEAARIMAQHQIRRLPVVDGENLIGVVSLGDLAVERLTDNQAKIALSEISEPNHEKFLN